MVTAVGTTTTTDNEKKTKKQDETRNRKSVNSPTTSRIIYGHDAPINRYPYTVSLQGSRGHSCGGTLIASDIILSAAHCLITDTIKKAIINPYNIDRPQKYTQTVPINKLIQHPSFDDNSMINRFRYDVAVIQINTTKYATNLDNTNIMFPPIRLQQKDDLHDLSSSTTENFLSATTAKKNQSKIPSSPLRVLGWGYTEWNELSSTLQEVDATPMVSNEECHRFMLSQLLNTTNLDAEDFYFSITPDMICTTSNDVNSGDSGGPLILPGNDHTTDIQVGIVSFGLPYLNVFTRVSEVYNWIRFQVCNLSNNPPDHFECTIDEDNGSSTTVTWSPMPTNSPTAPTFSPVPTVETISVTVEIQLDSDPEDTGWQIILPHNNNSLSTNNTSNKADIVHAVPYGTYNVAMMNTAVQETVVLNKYTTYKFYLEDRAYDGLNGRVIIYLGDNPKRNKVLGFYDPSISNYDRKNKNYFEDLIDKKKNKKILPKEPKQKNHQFVSRIVGGDFARGGEFPFMVSWHDSFSSYPSCGASLISPNLVLTAAHCAGIPGGVRIGSLKARSLYNSFPTGVEVNVIAEIRHPEYYFDVDYTLGFDYMILVLDQDVDTSIYTPITLNFDPEQPKPDDMLTTIGFGTLSSGLQANTLMKVRVPANDHATCSSQYPGVRNDIHLCAGYIQGGKDSCQGDSGGPIFKEINGVTSQVGIVSFGEGCGRPGYSGVYARLSGVSSWLKSEICTRSSEPKPSYCKGNINYPETPSDDRENLFQRRYVIEFHTSEDSIILSEDTNIIPTSVPSDFPTSSMEPTVPLSPTISQAPTEVPVQVLIEIQLDYYPFETYWQITEEDNTNNIICGKKAGTYSIASALVYEEITLPSNRRYTFYLKDTYGDGFQQSQQNNRPFVIIYFGPNVERSKVLGIYENSDSFEDSYEIQFQTSEDVIIDVFFPTSTPSFSPSRTPSTRPSVSLIPTTAPTTSHMPSLSFMPTNKVVTILVEIEIYSYAYESSWQLISTTTDDSDYTAPTIIYEGNGSSLFCYDAYYKEINDISYNETYAFILKDSHGDGLRGYVNIYLGSIADRNKILGYYDYRLDSFYYRYEIPFRASEDGIVDSIFPTSTPTSTPSRTPITPPSMSLSPTSTPSRTPSTRPSMSLIPTSTPTSTPSLFPTTPTISPMPSLSSLPTNNVVTILIEISIYSYNYESSWELISTTMDEGDDITTNIIYEGNGSSISNFDVFYKEINDLSYNKTYAFILKDSFGDGLRGYAIVYFGSIADNNKILGYYDSKLDSFSDRYEIPFRASEDGIVDAIFPTSAPTLSLLPTMAPTNSPIPSLSFMPTNKDVTILIEIKLDSYPSETTWELTSTATDSNDNDPTTTSSTILYEENPFDLYSYDVSYDTIYTEIASPTITYDEIYTFILKDSCGDGLVGHVFIYLGPIPDKDKILGHYDHQSNSFSSRYVISFQASEEGIIKNSTIMEGCSVCGENKEMSKLDGILAFSGLPAISCKELEEAGRNGTIALDSCQQLSLIIEEICGCQIIAEESRNGNDNGSDWW